MNNEPKKPSNVVRGRVQSKSDTTENWNNAPNFIPLKGEICIYTDYYGENTPAIKVGDGKTRIQDLHFLGFEAHYDVEYIDSGTSTTVID